MTQSKLRAEKVEKPLVRDEGAVAGSFYPNPKTRWLGEVGKAAEVEFPLILLGVALTRGSKWKARRAVDWEEPVEWKFLTVCHSPSVEQLWERFSGLEMHGVASMKLSVWGAGLEIGQALAASSPSLPQLAGSRSMGQGAVGPLSWLKKWNLSVDWEGNKWHLRNKTGNPQGMEKMHRVG